MWPLPKQHESNEETMSEQSCIICRHAFEAGVRDGKPARVCRRYPPQTHFIMILRPATTAMALKGAGSMVPVEEQRSAFPAVMDNWACGEFVPRLEMLS